MLLFVLLYILNLRYWSMDRQDGLLVDNTTNVTICSDEHYYT